MLLTLVPIVGLLAFPETDPSAALRLAERAAATGRMDAALWLYETVAFRQAPRAPAFWLNLGRLRERSGDAVGALQAYRTLPRLTELPPEGWWENLQGVRRRLAEAEGQETPPLSLLRDAGAAWALRALWPFLAAAFAAALALLPLFLLTVFGPPALRPWACRLFIALVLAILGGALLLTCALPRELTDRNQMWIIVRRPADLREGNGASYAAASARAASAGAEGRLLARRPNGWVRVELDDGRTGWLPEAAILLAPRSD